MWTKITRSKHDRSGLRHASDLTGAEWARIEPFLPERRATGRPWTTAFREAVSAIM